MDGPAPVGNKRTPLRHWMRAPRLRHAWLFGGLSHPFLAPVCRSMIRSCVQENRPCRASWGAAKLPSRMGWPWRAAGRLLGGPEGRSEWSLRLLSDKMMELGIVDTLGHETVWRTLRTGRSTTALSLISASNGSSRRSKMFGLSMGLVSNLHSTAVPVLSEPSVSAGPERSRSLGAALWRKRTS